METAKGKTREETITKLAERIDKFEKYPGPHSRLMAEMAVRLARRFGLTQTDVHAIAEAALLHDIGLYALSPAYHSATTPLNLEQRMDLWRHPVVGEQQLAKRDSTRHAQLLVRWHHEWWNGSGYPDMLAFEDIPIGARILRAVELYSALISDRPYRSRLGEEEALESLRSSAGIECDPYVVKAMIALLEELRAAETEADSTAPAEILSQAPRAPDAQPAGDLADGNADPAGVVAAVTANDAQTAPDEQTVGKTAGEETSGEAASQPLPAFERLFLRARTKEAAEDEAQLWHDWTPSRYNNKSLLGFEASVLRQIDFRSIAVALAGSARLNWYLKLWNKLILSNDPRAWAAAASRATLATNTLKEDHISRILEDVYIPQARLGNRQLRRWFGETDAWWMDNLRRNIDAIEDESLRAQALLLGVQTGDYALSFTEETRDLMRPLTTIFWRLAGRAFKGPAGHPHNQTYSESVEDFTRRARADLFYLPLPSAHAGGGGAEARSEWRESWVNGPNSEHDDDIFRLMTVPQSKQGYLAMIDRVLRVAGHIKTWAIMYQETGLASASDIGELIKEHRPVRETYSKDLSEIAGGLRSYIIVAERA